MSATLNTTLSRLVSASSVHEIAGVLERRGWTNIGSGAFASAYIHPDLPDRVLKVFTADSAYLAYLKQVVMPLQGRNPHVPVVHAFTPLSRLGPSAGVVLLEKLSKADGSATEAMRSKLDSVARFGQNEARVKGLPRDLIRLGNRIHATRVREATRREKVGQCRRENAIPGVDMHGGNVMMRGAVMVVTDPIAF